MLLLLPLLLQVVYNVVSGSEANELAWRIACSAARGGGATEPLHVAVMDHGELGCVQPAAGWRGELCLGRGSLSTRV